MQATFAPTEFQAAVICQLEKSDSIVNSASRLEYCTVGFNEGNPKKRAVVGLFFIVNHDRGIAYCLPPQSSLKKLTAKSITLEQQMQGFAQMMSAILNKACPSDSDTEHYYRAYFKNDRSISMISAVRSEDEYKKLRVILDRIGYARLKDIPTPNAV